MPLSIQTIAKGCVWNVCVKQPQSLALEHDRNLRGHMVKFEIPALCGCLKSKHLLLWKLGLILYLIMKMKLKPLYHQENQKLTFNILHWLQTLHLSITPCYNHYVNV